MSDLISRQAAINKARERLIETALNNVGIKQNVDEVLVDVAEERLENWLDEVPSAQPEQRWIPVTERLPEKGQKCLVSDRDCIAIDVFLGRGGVYNWQFYLRDYEAWMPLPEPYKGGGEGEN